MENENVAAIVKHGTVGADRQVTVTAPPTHSFWEEFDKWLAVALKVIPVIVPALPTGAQAPVEIATEVTQVAAGIAEQASQH